MKGKPIEVSATAGILSIKIQGREIINERIGDDWLFDLGLSKAISYKEAFHSHSISAANIGDHRGAKEFRKSCNNFTRYIAHYDLVHNYINKIN